MKKNNKKGFTLAELLIVIAIIAVLVAIAIPVFSSSIDKAEKAVDDANMRAIKAIATVDLLEDGVFTKTVYYVSTTGDISENTSDGATAYTAELKTVDGTDTIVVTKGNNAG